MTSTRQQIIEDVKATRDDLAVAVTEAFQGLPGINAQAVGDLIANQVTTLIVDAILAARALTHPRGQYL